LPFFVTAHTCVCVSAVPGSVNVPDTLIAVPSGLDSGAPLIVVPHLDEAGSLIECAKQGRRYTV
jgi:hypothetical protein